MMTTNFVHTIWKRTAPENDITLPLPNGKFITEWVVIEEDEECFGKAIEYLQLWKYFMMIKCKDEYELYDEQLIFKPALYSDILKQPPTICVKLYLKAVTNSPM